MLLDQRGMQILRVKKLNPGHPETFAKLACVIHSQIAILKNRARPLLHLQLFVGRSYDDRHIPYITRVVLQYDPFHDSNG